MENIWQILLANFIGKYLANIIGKYLIETHKQQYNKIGGKRQYKAFTGYIGYCCKRSSVHAIDDT